MAHGRQGKVGTPSIRNQSLFSVGKGQRASDWPDQPFTEPAVKPRTK